MSLTDILNDINDEKQKALDKLETQFAEKIAEMDSLHEKRKEGLKKEYQNRVEEKRAGIEKKMQAQTNMERKTLILAAKREVLNKTFASAIETLANSKNYEAILSKLLSDVTLKDAEVIVAKGKKPETINALKKAKKNYKILDEGDFTGGCIVISDSVEIDLSFETLVNDLRTDLETDIAHKLFG